VGILKVLFGSRSGNAKSFVNWATATLFTAQMGTVTERKKLAANIVNPADIKAFSSKTDQVLPVIYLFTLGVVKDLRKTFNIDERYKDFERRSIEHQKDFSKLKNAKLELAHYNFVDKKYIFAAEADLKDTFNLMNFVLEHETYKEIIIFNKTLMPKIKKQYESISKSYVGHIAEAITRINELESKHANELLKKDLELVNEKHLNEMLKKDMEIMKKDMEIMKLTK